MRMFRNHDVIRWNRKAWNNLVEQGNRWTVCVDTQTINAARQGIWEIYLTPNKPIPGEWLGNLANIEILCLASGGGQQAPILAAAGARVTVVDLSPAQLDQDRLVAEREGLEIIAHEGDMQNLSYFPDQYFDLVLNPVSTCFVPDVRKVWAEAYRVLKPKGRLITGFINPIDYCFDEELEKTGMFLVVNPIPYSDIGSHSIKKHQKKFGDSAPVEFSHTLSDLIGGQMEVGFRLMGFFEDRRMDQPIGQYYPSFIVTMAEK